MQVNHRENILEVKNIFFNHGDREVLRDITLDIHRGDYLGIVGSNGSGKTTLIKIMLGLLNPSQGSVKFFGKDIKKFKDWSKIGYVPQKVTNVDANFPVTAKEVVMMARYAKRGLFRRITKEDGNIAEKALLQVGMLESKDRLIGDLSAGQQQRVFIARALAGEPEVIFLDEPTTGVDQKSQDDFYSLLKKLNTDLELTLVLVTHDIERILKEAMHIVCIDHTLICYTSPEEFISNNPSLDLQGYMKKIIEHRHNFKNI